MEQEKYNSQYHQNVHFVTEEQFNTISLYRAKKLQHFIIEQDVILEYGVGNTWNLANLKCQEKVGYDIFIEDYFHKSSIKLLTNENEIPKYYFDKVICHHVIEHVENPFQTLTEIKSYLKPSGSFICYVPYREKEKWSKNFNAQDKNQHLYSWNAQTLCMLLTRAGFTIKSCQIKLTGFDRFAAVIISKYKLPKAFYPVIRKSLQLLKQDYEIEVIAN